jgi:hypothetical protein
MQGSRTERHSSHKRGYNREHRWKFMADAGREKFSPDYLISERSKPGAKE